MRTPPIRSYMPLVWLDTKFDGKMASRNPLKRHNFLQARFGDLQYHSG